MNTNAFKTVGQAMTRAWRKPEKWKSVRVGAVDGSGRPEWANPIVLKKIDG
jgi:hypothetical protein